MPLAGSDRSWNLAQAVHRHSRLRPDAPAVADERRALSYREFAAEAAAVAGHLRRLCGEPEAGSGPPRVAILASRSAEACVAVVGASWAGATYVPLGHKLPPDRLARLLSLCGPSALVVDAQGARLLTAAVRALAPPVILGIGLPAAGHEGVTWITAESEAAAPPPSPMRPDDPAYIIFTSGTTGMPKGVVVPVSAVRHYLRTITAHLGLAASDRALETCELTFDFSVHNMFSTWEAGASLHILPATRALNAARFAREHALTVWNSVPSLVGMLGQVKALAPGALPDLRLTVFGGEALTRGIVEAWRAAAPASVIHNLYGPTEATVFCLAQRVGDPLPLRPDSDVVAIGSPLPGSEAAVLGPDGQPVADGRTGELALAGVQLASSYLDAPEQTRARFVPLGGKRWYLTGDSALRDPGGCFHCRGRLDNQVKVLGHRIELEEVDAHLRQVAGTGLAAAVAWPIRDGAAQGLVGFVAGAGIDTVQSQQTLRQRLPPYMVPARIIAIASMPVSASGKIDRQALQHLLQAGTSP